MKRKALIILIAALVLVGGTFGTVIGLLSDDTNDTNTAIAEKNVTLEDALVHQAVCALENTSDDRAVTLRLNEYDMNEILYAVSKGIEIDGVEIISIYVKFYPDEYKIFIPVKILGIKSLVSGNLKLYEVENVIHAQIHDMKIGNLGSGSIEAALGAFEKSIISALEKLHITSVVEGDSVRAEISRENLALMIGELTEESPSRGLILAVYDLFMLRTNSVSLNLDIPEECSVVVDFSTFGGSSSEQFDSFRPTVSGYVSNGIANKDNLNPLSKYYVNGYERLKDEEKEQVDTAFAPFMSVEAIAAHKGLIKRAGTLENVFNLLVRDPFENVFAGLLGGSLLNISGDSVSDVLGCIDLVGLTVPLVSYRDNSTTYIIIQSMRANIFDGGLTISVEVNANGFVLPVSVTVAVAPSPLTGITGVLTGISVGTVSLVGEDLVYMHNYLCDSLALDGITFTPENLGVLVDLTKLIKLDLGFLGKTPSKFYISCEDGSSNGRLKVTMKLK